MLPPHLKKDIQFLLENDSVFKKTNIEISHFSWSERDDMFTSLMRTIVGQQLSVKAAATIWQRVADGVGDISATGFLKCDDETFRGYGLSRQKISYVRGLAEAVKAKTFIPDSLHDMNDEDVLQSITSLKGFGEWSAQMVLIFTLHRPDIWPIGDLGVREGIRLYKKSDERPDITATEKFGNKFKGRRTSAALLLWKLKDSS
jgi:DNA-3-methyladenine glycosylase II